MNESPVKHNGRLDDERDCHVSHSPVTTSCGIRDGIRIESDWNWAEQWIDLSADQALSLLEWLKQEEEALRKNVP